MQQTEIGQTEHDVELKFPRANIVAVEAISRVLASSLGPASRDKLVVQQPETREDSSAAPPFGEYVATSDGATILDKLPLGHPIGRLVGGILGPEQTDEETVEGAEIRDGVSTTVVLLAAMLSEAESLIEQGVHPYTVCAGYMRGLDVVLGTIDEETRELSLPQNAHSAEWHVARTALTGNDVGGFAERWAEAAVEVVETIGMPDEVTMAVRATRTGSIADSRVIHGAVLDRNKLCHSEMSKRVTDANVLVLSGYDSGGGLQDPDTKKISVETDDPETIAGIDEPLFARRRAVVETLVAAGVDVVVARQGIIPAYQQLLVDNDIVGIRGVNRIDLRQVALATGASLVQDITDVSADDLGRAGVVEEVTGDSRPGSTRTRRMVVFDGCSDPDSVCIQLHGVSGQLAAQATTMLRQAAAAVATAKGYGGAQPGIVPGGGAVDLRIARRLRHAARSEGSRIGLAMEAFADAAEEIPATLARNAGLDVLTTVANAKTKQDSEGSTAGLILPEGTIGDVLDAGVVDPTANRKQIYVTATELAVLVLRVDDAIDAEFTEVAPDPDDAIYDDVAEQQQDHLKRNPDSHRFDELAD